MYTTGFDDALSELFNVNPVDETCVRFKLTSSDELLPLL